MQGTELDAELAAIQAVIDALEPLDAGSRDRVIAYAFDRLGLATPRAAQAPTGVTPSEVREMPAFREQRLAATDVRALRAEKQPRSANEMAAIVGYYLAELAPNGERKSEITTDDIKEYFKQAGHPLPNVPRQTLNNAAAAGYFESLGGGRYRLNPVGHNLVAHNLPRSGQESSGTKRRRPARSRSADSKVQKKVGSTRGKQRKS